MTTRKRIWIATGVLTGLALLAIPAYQPLKFHYAIWRIESATTAKQERTACILASRVGHVWEVNQIDQSEFRALPSRVKPQVNEVVTEIEWWEGPWWKGMGQPYRAYRVLLDPQNREFLVARSKSNRRLTWPTPWTPDCAFVAFKCHWPAPVKSIIIRKRTLHLCVRV